MAYHVLVARDVSNKAAPGAWEVQFGDRDASVVREEMQEQKCNSRISGYREEFRIIRTKSARQSAVNAAVAKLNAGS